MGDWLGTEARVVYIHGPRRGVITHACKRKAKGGPVKVLVVGADPADLDMGLLVPKILAVVELPKPCPRFLKKGGRVVGSSDLIAEVFSVVLCKRNVKLTTLPAEQFFEIKITGSNESIDGSTFSPVASHGVAKCKELVDTQKRDPTIRQILA